MSTLSLRLPESLHAHLADVAAREGVSINQLISSAVAEKMAALLTQEYLEKRAARGARARFTAALARIPDEDPEPTDRLAAASPRSTLARTEPRRSTRTRK